MIKQHPTLPILCNSETGEVQLPAAYNKKAHWTLGCVTQHGYRQVRYNKKSYYVHRLMADTFLEPDPSRPLVDHINRDRSDSRLINIRRCNYSENALNTVKADQTLATYGMHKCDDRKEYRRRYEAKRKEDRLCTAA